jgi:hypothetical protein
MALPKIGETISAEEFVKLPGVGETISAEMFEALPAQVAQPKPQMNLLQALGTGVTQIPKSGARFVGDIFSALTSPIKTLESVVALGAGAVQKLIPGRQKQEETFDVVADFYKDRYGSYESFKEAIADDPVGVLADFSVVATGGAAAGARIPKLAQLAGRVGKVGRATDPLRLLGRGVGVTGRRVGERIPSLAVPLEERAIRFYQSALKPTVAVEKKFPDVVKTGIKEEIIVGADGLEKARNVIDKLNDEITARIAKSTKTGAVIKTKDIVKSLEDVRTQLMSDVSPGESLALLKALEKDFRGAHGTRLTPKRAQEIKISSYKRLRKSYGELKSAQIEGKKGLVRGVKTEIEKVIPEVKGLNARERQLIGLDKALITAVRRMKNRDVVGLGEIGAAGAGAVATGGIGGLALGLVKRVIDSPGIKSRLAIALNKLAKRKKRPLSPQSRAFLRSLTPTARITEPERERRAPTVRGSFERRGF